MKNTNYPGQWASVRFVCNPLQIVYTPCWNHYLGRLLRPENLGRWNQNGYRDRRTSIVQSKYPSGGTEGPASLINLWTLGERDVWGYDRLDFASIWSFVPPVSTFGSASRHQSDNFTQYPISGESGWKKGVNGTPSPPSARPSCLGALFGGPWCTSPLLGENAAHRNLLS